MDNQQLSPNTQWPETQLDTTANKNALAYTLLVTWGATTHFTQPKLLGKRMWTIMQTNSQFPDLCVRNNNAEPHLQPVRKGFSHSIHQIAEENDVGKTQEIPVRENEKREGNSLRENAQQSGGRELQAPECLATRGEEENACVRPKSSRACA